MGQLKLYGMKAAYDEIIATAVKRQHEPQHIVGDLLNAEISEKQARSVKYQMTIAKLPLAKEIEEFAFDDTPINETLVRDLCQRRASWRSSAIVVLIGGTGTGKTHIAAGDRPRLHPRRQPAGRFFNTVDLVNKLEAEARVGRQGRTADLLCRLDFLILDELGYLPFAQAGGQLLFHLDQPALRADLGDRHHQPRLRRMAERVRRREDDDGAPRPADASLRDHRDRQRELALQIPRLRPGNPLARTGYAIWQLRRLGPASRQSRGSILDADQGSIFSAD